MLASYAKAKKKPNPPKKNPVPENTYLNRHCLLIDGFPHRKTNIFFIYNKARHSSTTENRCRNRQKTDAKILVCTIRIMKEWEKKNANPTVVHQITKSTFTSWREVSFPGSAWLGNAMFTYWKGERPLEILQRWSKIWSFENLTCT